MTTLRKIQTDTLEIAYEVSGASEGPTIVLVHGWPDDVRCWDRVASRLAAQGFRILCPYLRGTGPTSFLSGNTMRSGQIAALGNDLAQFLERLDLNDTLLIGHDWGARAGYVVGALHPTRIRGLIAMSAGYATSVPIRDMEYEQVRAYWYEWLMATKRGQEALATDRRRLCRFLWQTWSPNWTFIEEEFAATTSSWDNPDWAAISIHAYLHRWGEVGGAPELERIEAELNSNPPVLVPTLVLHGGDDQDNFPETSEGKEPYFRNGYKRTVVPRAGHFLPREVPSLIAGEILEFHQGIGHEHAA